MTVTWTVFCGQIWDFRLLLMLCSMEVCCVWPSVGVSSEYESSALLPRPDFLEATDLRESERRALRGPALVAVRWDPDLAELAYSPTVRPTFIEAAERTEPADRLERVDRRDLVGDDLLLRLFWLDLLDSADLVGEREALRRLDLGPFVPPERVFSPVGVSLASEGTRAGVRGVLFRPEIGVPPPRLNWEVGALVLRS